MDQNQQPQDAAPEVEATPAPEINATDSTPVQETPQEDSSGLGATIGSVIVIVVLILGGFYLWSQRNADIEALLDAPLPETDQSVELLQAQSTSDEIESIESDLNATDLNDLDAELADIDALLNAEI